jgi:hypothetical protein
MKAFPVKLYVAFALAVGIGLALSIISTTRADTTLQDNAAVIKFPHKLHIIDVGAACTDCHGAAETSTRSSDKLLPGKPVCESCHEEQLSENCTFCHLNEDTDTYRAFANPVRDIVFSHAAHVTERSMECTTCHQGVDQAERPGKDHTPPMALCNTCHNDATASNVCETCHLDMAALRPADHNRTDFVREHKQIARLSQETCQSCHTVETCQDCHASVGLTAQFDGGRDLASPRSPRLFSIDRGQGLVLEKVHDLNFRYTHGAVASSKTQECASCHSTKEFCSECHAAGGNVNQESFRPTSHEQAGFAIIGVGSGGGLHATLAKRDIESCAACHDTQGADPTCVACHIDPDGVRGTNPKTHQRGFMLTNEGEWHSDPGASCFVCHVDANARPGGLPGIGFCGYCHQS